MTFTVALIFEIYKRKKNVIYLTSLVFQVQTTCCCNLSSNSSWSFPYQVENQQDVENKLRTKNLHQWNTYAAGRAAHNTLVLDRHV